MNCIRRELECVYASVPRRRGPGKAPKGLKSKRAQQGASESTSTQDIAQEGPSTSSTSRSGRRLSTALMQRTSSGDPASSAFGQSPVSPVAALVEGGPSSAAGPNPPTREFASSSSEDPSTFERPLKKFKRESPSEDLPGEGFFGSGHRFPPYRREGEDDDDKLR